MEDFSETIKRINELPEDKRKALSHEDISILEQLERNFLVCEDMKNKTFADANSSDAIKKEMETLLEASRQNLHDFKVKHNLY